MAEPDYRNGYRAEEVRAREEAAALGEILGAVLVAAAQAELDKALDPSMDPYLEYLVWSRAAQYVANEGRRVGKVDFTKADNALEGRKRG